jgi:hypothetical protein
MAKRKQRRIVEKLSPSLSRRLRRSRALIARELPDLMAKDQQLYDAMRERTPSGALRRAIHSSQLLLPDLADRAQVDMNELDAFLTAERPLDSDSIDRLAGVLKLRLAPIASASKSRRSKAG